MQKFGVRPNSHSVCVSAMARPFSSLFLYYTTRHSKQRTQSLDRGPGFRTHTHTQRRTIFLNIYIYIYRYRPAVPSP